MVKPTDTAKQLKQLQKLHKQTSNQLKQLNKAQTAAAKATEGPREQSQLGKLFGAVTGAFAETANEMRNNFAPDAQSLKQSGQSGTPMSDHILNAVQGAQHGVGSQQGSHTFADAPLLPPQMESDGPPNPLFEHPVWDFLTQPVPARPKVRFDSCFHPTTLAELHAYMKVWEQETDYPYTATLAAVEAADKPLFKTLAAVMESLPQLYGAVGFGPRHIQPDINELDTTLTDLLNDNPKLLAVGPMGLDLHFSPHTQTEQTEQLYRQLEIAADFELPALLTQTKAAAELAQAIADAPAKPAQMVWVDAVKTEGEAAIVTALVASHPVHVLVRAEATYAGNQAYRTLLSTLPEDKLLLASGIGLLATQANSGKTNTPNGLAEILTTLATLRNADAQALLRTLNGNAARVFGPQTAET